MKKIIAVGATTQNNTLVNGQSMMFQLFVDNLKQKNIKTIIVDFGLSISKRTNDTRISGKFSKIKAVDNILVLLKFLWAILTNIGSPIYITTSQSKVGFVRDYLFINIGKFFKSKIIAHQFGSNYNKFYNSQSDFFKNLILKTLKKVDYIAVEGDFTKKQFSFLPDYERKVVSIPNGLPEKINSKEIEPKTLKNNEPINLIYLSNLIETKGYWDVLEALNILVNQHNINVNAIFSGKFLGDIGDEKFSSAQEAKQEFFNYIKNNKLENRVKYYEGLYGDEKSIAFKKSHFFLLPSYYINEGQPVSIVEALAYGCVPIVTEYRLIPSMVNKENGIFVQPKSPSEIASVIKKLADNHAKYNEYSKNGINYYLNNFTSEKYTNRLISLFNI